MQILWETLYKIFFTPPSPQKENTDLFVGPSKRMQQSGGICWGLIIVASSMLGPQTYVSTCSETEDVILSKKSLTH